MFSSILCPVDFSSHSRIALQYAAAVAERAGGRLTALFVNDPLLVAAAAANYDARALARTSAAELRQFVERALGKRTRGSFRVVHATVQGNPAGEIQRAAKRTKAELIVIGSQGLSGARKLFFGSTTERVLRQAQVPVLAVPPAGEGIGRQGSWPGSPLIAALDLGPKLAVDAERAAAVARWFDAGLLLAHIVAPTQAPRWLSAPLRQHDRERVTQARARLERLCRKLGDGANVDCQVRVGNPAEQIAAMAADVHAGLVMITLRAVSGFVFDTPQGATTYRVLGGTETPVLALPGK